jgi:hypothetical protein
VKSSSAVSYSAANLCVSASLRESPSARRAKRCEYPQASADSFHTPESEGFRSKASHRLAAAEKDLEPGNDLLSLQAFPQ